MEINWKQKLTSRKFWAAVAAAVLSLCVVFGVPEVTQQQLTGVIMACGSLIAYILGEGFVDAARLKSARQSQAEAAPDKTICQKG